MTLPIKQSSINHKKSAAAHLADKLQAGRVYRRMDLAHLSKSVDRHLNLLLFIGKLKKLTQGLYYVPI